MDSFTCPMRSKVSTQNLDMWKKTGSYKMCSYCGSIHPDNFKLIVIESITDKSIIVDLSLNHKFHIYNDNINYILKFSTMHIPNDDYVKELNKYLPRALHNSKLRQHQKLDNEIIERVKGNKND